MNKRPNSIDDLVDAYVSEMEDRTGVSIASMDYSYEELEDSARRIEEASNSAGLDSVDVYKMGTKASTWDMFVDVFDISNKASKAGKAAFSAAAIVTLYLAMSAIGAAILTALGKITTLFSKEMRKCSTLLGDDELICMTDARIKILEAEMSILKTKIKKACKNATDVDRCKGDVKRRIDEIKTAIKHFDALKISLEKKVAKR